MFRTGHLYWVLELKIKKKKKKEKKGALERNYVLYTYMRVCKDVYNMLDCKMSTSEENWKTEEKEKEKVKR